MRSRSIPVLAALFLSVAPIAAAPAPLETEPVKVESLGLAICPPLGAKIERGEVNTVLVFSMTDPLDPPAWKVSFKPLIARVGDGSPQALVEQHLQQLEAAKSDFTVLGNERFVTTDNLEGWVLYLRSVVPNPTTGDPTVSHSGWLVLPNGAGHFVVGIAAIDEKDFKSSRAALEESYRTIKLTTVKEISKERRQDFDAGADLLKTFTPDHLHSLVGFDQWYRVYVPATEAEGEREIGVYHIIISQQPRGRLNPERLEEDYDSAEHVQGVMVEVAARSVGDVAKNVYYDSLGLYWMTWDRAEEAWSVRSTIRQGQAERTEAEMGYRTAGPRPRLTVVDGKARNLSRTENSWDVPPAYLSQAEHWMLPMLLPRDPASSGEYGFYFYNAAKGEMIRRTDRWTAADHAAGVSNWSLTTALGSDAQPVVTSCDPLGRPMQQTRANGSMVVPATAEQLRRLWEGKGLQLIPGEQKTPSKPLRRPAQPDRSEPRPPR